MDYKTIILEGKTDETFFLGYLNQKYGIRRCLMEENIKHIGYEFSQIIAINGFDSFHLIIIIADGKSNLVPKAKPIIKGILGGVIQNTQKIGIFIDLDKNTRDEKITSIFDQLKNVNTALSQKTNFGCQISTLPIFIFTIGDINLVHQCEKWQHCLEDYLILVLRDSSNEEIKKVYEIITKGAIEKGLAYDLKTSTKSPIQINLAFDDADNLQDYYKKLVATDFTKIESILVKCGVDAYFHQFLS